MGIREGKGGEVVKKMKIQGLTGIRTQVTGFKVLCHNQLDHETAPDVGLEPTTTRLKVWRSTD